MICFISYPATLSQVSHRSGFPNLPSAKGLYGQGLFRGQSGSLGALGAGDDRHIMCFQGFPGVQMMVQSIQASNLFGPTANTLLPTLCQHLNISLTSQMEYTSECSSGPLFECFFEL
jgi:hypothetical protein